MITRLLKLLICLVVVSASATANNLRHGDWIYTEWNTDKTLFDVAIKSNSAVSLAYGVDDYNGSDRAEFKVSEKPNGLRSVYLSLGRAIIKDEFLCLYQCFIAVRFDDGPYEQYIALSESRHDTSRISGHYLHGVGEESVLTIQSNGAIERKISEASTMTILVDFYQGHYSKESHEFVFNVNNLNINDLVSSYR